MTDPISKNAEGNATPQPPASMWSRFTTYVTSAFESVADGLQSAAVELKSIAKKIQPLHEANKTINKLIATTLNEANQLAPPPHASQIKKLTNKIPHTKQKNQNNNLEFKYPSISDKYRELKNISIATQPSIDQSTPQQNIEQIAHHLYSATNFLLLEWPKTTFENLQNLYNLRVVSNSEYQPQLPQISQWVMPEAKEANALGQPVKIAHQTFYALQLLISSCRQIAFLITIQNGYSVFQQAQDKGRSYFETFVPVFSGMTPSLDTELVSLYNSSLQCDARLSLMQPPLERGYLINGIDFSWYCSALLLTLNSLVFLYYLKTLHANDLNLQPFLNPLLNFPNQIKKYIASAPWPTETINERKESYQYSKQFFFSPPADEKKPHTLKPAYVAAASSLYEKTQCIIPFIAKPAAEITTKLLMWGIASYFLKVKDYLRDVSIQNPGETAQLTYGLMPWLYHQSGMANALRTTFGATPSPDNNDGSYLFDAQFTGYTLRQVEIFMWVWFFSPLLFGFFQVLMEKAYNRYCKLTPEAFEEKLTQVTDVSLKNYYFNSDELPLVENISEYKESKENKNDKEDKEENEELVGYKEILKCLPSVDDVLKPVANYLTSNPKDIRQSAYAKLAVQYSQKIAAILPLSKIPPAYDSACNSCRTRYSEIYLTIKYGTIICSEGMIDAANWVINKPRYLAQFGLNKLGYFFTSLIIDNAGVVYQGAVKMVNGMRPLRMQDGRAPFIKFQEAKLERPSPLLQIALIVLIVLLALIVRIARIAQRALTALTPNQNADLLAPERQRPEEKINASEEKGIAAARRLAQITEQNANNRYNYWRSLPPPNFSQNEPVLIAASASQAPVSPPEIKYEEEKIEPLSPAVNRTPPPDDIDKYINERKEGKKYEAFRLFMTKQRKVAAAESLKTPNVTPENNWDFNALFHGDLRKIIQDHHDEFKGTKLEGALNDHGKEIVEAIENLRKFRKLSPAL